LAKKLDELKQDNVLVVGLGGFGAYASEQLCRAGIGKMTLFAGDVVDITNRNRQLPGLISNNKKNKSRDSGKSFSGNQFGNGNQYH